MMNTEILASLTHDIEILGACMIDPVDGDTQVVRLLHRIETNARYLLDQAVADARADGTTWEKIATLTDRSSRQAAYERFAHMATGLD